MSKRTSKKSALVTRRRTSRANPRPRRQTYGGDPMWITAKYDSHDDEGRKVRKGDRVLYWPSLRRVQSGEKADAAWRRFLSEKGDDEGTPYASNPRRSRANHRASYEQTYYVRLDPEDAWNLYGVPTNGGEFVMHAPRDMKVSEHMTLAEARKVAKSYLDDPEMTVDHLEIARYAGSGYVGKNFMSMLEETVWKKGVKKRPWGRTLAGKRKR